jgi:hypothetical protein
MQFSVDVRDAMNDAIETVLGTSPHLKVFTGAIPANCAAADTGTLLADATLPSDWLGASSGGVKSLSGTWQDLSADGTGTPGYYRLYTSGGTCKLQGTASVGAGGELQFNGTFTAGQSVSVTSYSITAANS